MSKRNSRIARGFSLLEVMLVVVIIGLLAAIAIPKFSRGAAGADDSAVSSNLAVLRNAMDLYQAEHGGSFPSATAAATQLTLYSDSTGATQAAKDTSHCYGPYLRTVPALPVGAAKGSAGIAAAAGSGVGWIYDATAGTVKTNTTSSENDSNGVAYTTY